MAAEPGYLRNQPRQARSMARVELLLDVAESVFEEVGYDAATTNLVASRAEVPVGTLYRWFPDKAALAEALADRYLDEMLTLYNDLLSSIEPGERIGDYLRRVLQRSASQAAQHRALSALLLSAMVPGGRSPAGERLRQGLEGHIRSLIEVRIPGVPEDIRDLTAQVCATLSHLVIASASDGPESSHNKALTAEYIDALIAYLEAKFPSADHPSWTDPTAPIKPLYPAPDRAQRLAGP